MDKKDFINDLTIKLADVVTIPVKDLQELIQQSISNYAVMEMDTTLPSTGDGSATLYLLEKFAKSKYNEGMNAKSFAQYQLAIRDLCNVAQKEITLIDTDDINNYFVWCRNRGNSERTISCRRCCINSFLEYIFAHGFINKNPMKLADKIKYRKHKEDALTNAQIEQIKMHLSENHTYKNVRDLAIIYFFLDTGCRVAELCSINVNDVDWVKRKVNIIGKGNKERTIYFTMSTLLRISDYLSFRKDITQDVNGFFSSDDMPLFCTIRKPKRLAVDDVERNVRELGRTLNMPLHPHLFRKTFATKHAEKNTPITLIKDLMGHESIETTEGYIKLSESSKQAYLSLAE